MPQTDSLNRLLDELDRQKRSFEPGSAKRLSGTLAVLGRRRFRDAGSLIRFHEALLYCRAYPQGPALLREAEKLLASFHGRAAGMDPDAFEEPEVSGVAGTAFSAVFSYEVVRRLTGLEPGRLAIDWDRYELTDRVAGAWRRLFPLVEEDTMVEAHVPYVEWLRAAAGGLENALGLSAGAAGAVAAGAQGQGRSVRLAGAAGALGVRTNGRVTDHHARSLQQAVLP